MTLVEQIECSGYTAVDPLWNRTNSELFLGPACLMGEKRIEKLEIYQRIIYTQEELDEVQSDGFSLLAPVAAGGAGDADAEAAEPLSNHLVGVFQLGHQMTSHNSIVHGGALASIIDEYFLKAAVALAPFVVTAKLSVSYRKPAQLQGDNITLVLDCFVMKNHENRKFEVRGCLRDLEGDVYCTADVLAVVPRKMPVSNGA